MSIIVTEGLSKTFQVDKSTTVEAVKDVNLCVEQGEIFGFVSVGSMMCDPYPWPARRWMMCFCS